MCRSWIRGVLLVRRLGLKQLLLVIALGSGLGGALRIIFGELSLGLGLATPWATFTANSLGSFLIGWLVGVWTSEGRSKQAPLAWHFWITGFCGGLTTFSLFSWEVLEFIQAGSGQIAGLYAASSMGIGIIGASLGFALSKRCVSDRDLEMDAPIIFYDRKESVRSEEVIYGERFLRWVYGNPLGRLTLTLVVKRVLFSRWYGWRMSLPASRKRIVPFIQKYNLDAREFAESVESYEHFNAFFWRKLRKEARPISGGVDQLVFPADGRHLVIPEVDAADTFYLKGQRFDLDAFIGDSDLAQAYKGGSMLISRLCPVDYHRYHFPLAGEVGESKLLLGSLSSVSPLALRRNLSIFWENRRSYSVLKTECFDTVLLFEIGATCVGGMHSTYRPGTIAQGAEKGYFSFGGSCVVTLFKPGMVTFDADLIEQSQAGIETYDLMGSHCGAARNLS